VDHDESQGRHREAGLHRPRPTSKFRSPTAFLFLPGDTVKDEEGNLGRVNMSCVDGGGRQWFYVFWPHLGITDCRGEQDLTQIED